MNRFTFYCILCILCINCTPPPPNPIVIDPCPPSIMDNVVYTMNDSLVSGYGHFFQFSPADTFMVFGASSYCSQQTFLDSTVVLILPLPFPFTGLPTTYDLTGNLGYIIDGTLTINSVTPDSLASGSFQYRFFANDGWFAPGDTFEASNGIFTNVKVQIP